MRVLALDTTTRAGSVALVDDDRILDERAGDRTRTHAERLPGEILDLVRTHGMSVNDVDVFAVASGPGSFTGLRIGISTIQGLALVTARSIVTVSALDALGEIGSGAEPSGTLVAAWMDAYRGEVFTALYRVTDAPRFTAKHLHEVEEASVAPPSVTLERWIGMVDGSRAIFIGNGAVLHAELIGTRLGVLASVLEPPPLAGIIGRLAVVRARIGQSVGPGGVRPLYVRRPDAEIARDLRG